MVAKIAEDVVLRPKTLSRSGEYRAVHAPENAASAETSQSLHAVPERHVTKSVRRERMQTALKALLRDALAADGIPYSDAAAACDRNKPHMIDLCAPDGRGVSAADLVLLARRSRTFREAVLGLLEEEKAK